MKTRMTRWLVPVALVGTIVLTGCAAMSGGSDVEASGLSMPEGEKGTTTTEGPSGPDDDAATLIFKGQANDICKVQWGALPPEPGDDAPADAQFAYLDSLTTAITRMADGMRALTPPRSQERAFEPVLDAFEAMSSDLADFNVARKSRDLHALEYLYKSIVGGSFTVEREAAAYGLPACSDPTP